MDKANRIEGHQLGVNYVCAACQLYFVKYMFKVSDDGKSIQKTGQYPPWLIEPTESLRAALGERLDVYKKGLINESQGYGIGAFAYYRRIVEDLIKCGERHFKGALGVDFDVAKDASEIGRSGKTGQS